MSSDIFLRLKNLMAPKGISSESNEKHESETDNQVGGRQIVLIRLCKTHEKLDKRPQEKIAKYQTCEPPVEAAGMLCTE